MIEAIKWLVNRAEVESGIDAVLAIGERTSENKAEGLAHESLLGHVVHCVTPMI
jgi:hypothetical protein